MWNDLKALVSEPSMLFKQLKQTPKVKSALFIVFILSFIHMFFGAFYVESSIFSEVGLDEMGGMWLSIVPISIASLFGPIFFITVVSLIIWVITKVVKTGATFTQLFSMYTYIVIVTTFGDVLNVIIQALVGSDGLIMVTSIGYLFNSDVSSPLHLLEVFFIWELILVGIGLQYTAGIRRMWAWIVVSLYVLFIFIIRILP
ncbi:YIP1 family protein [Cytobacillus kochii]|uniref:YIP1 family protein n=1 Tax=Cytobacillus kochii TaxID=859143 RepID=UPI001CD3B6A3|nr:YIP1 family protein [Cytobacillus kochii]MCA1028931.1 YIP1 family protein [Cytobacillus kochii]